MKVQQELVGALYYKKHIQYARCFTGLKKYINAYMRTSINAYAIIFPHMCKY